ncbi:MAG: hypothetical protein R3E55_04775 [Burkholderiaceae bacterium]
MKQVLYFRQALLALLRIQTAYFVVQQHDHAFQLLLAHTFQHIAEQVQRNAVDAQQKARDHQRQHDKQREKQTAHVRNKYP